MLGSFHLISHAISFATSLLCGRAGAERPTDLGQNFELGHRFSAWREG
jgi:hypothetical protein